jgi:hypothetical protein
MTAFWNFHFIRLHPPGAVDRVEGKSAIAEYFKGT